MPRTSRQDIRNLVIALCAVPIVSVWALVSLLPIAGLLAGEKPLFLLIADLLFLLTGFAGVAGGLIAAAALAHPRGRESMKALLKGRFGLVGAYAAVWLTLYGMASLAAG